MPNKKTQKLVHLDIDELAHTTPVAKEDDDTSLGGMLRAKRLKKKWEIEDVARKLRIKPIYLEALEQGHYYAFPARSYGVGFLRSYSKLLDLDPDKMTALFNQETSDEKEQPIDMLVVEKHFSLPSFKFIFAVFCLIFGLYLIWYGIAMGYYKDLLNQKIWPALFEKESIKSEESLPEVVPAPVAEEVQLEPEEVSEEEPAEQIEVALVATDTVWVGLKNTTTGEILVSKQFVKNERFMPETSINELAVSTGRPKLLDLYINGDKVHTFGRETWLPLAPFAEALHKTTNE